MKRVTPEDLDVISSDMFVLIGTNESGIHAGGIAAKAHKDWGLQWEKGFGPSGLCFGLPTKDWYLKQLPLSVINGYVERYIDWCQVTKGNHYVTKIGCGLAGYTVPDIAPMFKNCVRFKNMWLPQDFLDFYDGIYVAPPPVIPVKQRKTVKDDEDFGLGFRGW